MDEIDFQDINKRLVKSYGMIVVTSVQQVHDGVIVIFDCHDSATSQRTYQRLEHFERNAAGDTLRAKNGIILGHYR